MQPVTQRQPIDVTNWTAGLITEASPLNFPDGASLDEENFVLTRKGTRYRRLGLEYETGYTLTSLGVSATASGHAISNFLWTNVRENPNTDYLVHQFGNKLYVFDTSLSNISAQLLFGAPITLTATIGTQFSFAALQGKLIVATGDQAIRVINIESTGTYSVSYLSLKVRDFWGVDDGYDTDERTSTLTSLHAYNLYNQGWPDVFFSTNYTGSVGANPNSMNEGANVDPVAQTNTSLGKYPSNADVIYSAMTFLLNGRKAYYPYALQNIVSGNTPAAKGHFIIDLFDRSQGRKDAYDTDVANGAIHRVNYKSAIPTDQSTGGIKATAAYAGRIWYACSSGETGGDSRSPHVGTFVLFSQLVDSTTDITKCYQEADPTAEDISDLVATDGGYVQLPDAANIQALVPFGKMLLVFASNGVWAISGGTSGFSATEYQSEFISNNGLISKQSIVVTETAVVYWSRNGIYMLSPQGSTQVISAGKLEPQSLTEKTIQDLYNAIPYNSKQNAVGYYDDVAQRARWLYQATYDSNFPQKYTHELILDFSLPAWSRFSFQDISARTPRVTGYAPVPVARRGESNYKYSALAPQISGTYALTLAGLNNTSWVDWYTADISATSTASRGADAAAYLVTGYVTGGDSARAKSLPYVTVHFARTESFTPDSTATVASTFSAIEFSSTAGYVVGTDIGMWDDGQVVHMVNRLAYQASGTAYVAPMIRYSSDMGATWGSWIQPWEQSFSARSVSAGVYWSNKTLYNGALLAANIPDADFSLSGDWATKNHKALVVAWTNGVDGATNFPNAGYGFMKRDTSATYTMLGHARNAVTPSATGTVTLGMIVPSGTMFYRDYWDGVSVGSSTGTTTGTLVLRVKVGHQYINGVGRTGAFGTWTNNNYNQYQDSGTGSFTAMQLFTGFPSDPATSDPMDERGTGSVPINQGAQGNSSRYQARYGKTNDNQGAELYIKANHRADGSSRIYVASRNGGAFDATYDLTVTASYSNMSHTLCRAFEDTLTWKVFSMRYNSTYGQYLVMYSGDWRQQSLTATTSNTMTSKMLVSSIWNDGVGKTNGKAIVARGNGKYYIGYNDWDASGTRAFSVIRSTDIECGTWEKMINKDTSMYFEYISNAVAGTAGSGTEVMLFTAQGGLYEGRTSSRSLAYITRIEFRGSPLTSFAATSISLPFTH